MSKDVYKTIKRSIIATTNGIAATANEAVSNVINWDSSISRLSNPPVPASRRYWIHPPRVLRECRVEYIARLWGKTEVSEPRGSHVMHDAILKIRFQYEQNKCIAGHSGSKLPKVIIQINAEKIVIVDQKTNKNLYVFPLRRISFSADDKQDKRIFSFIVRTEDSKNVCFGFISEKMAEDITLTIGQAFDLAYEKYCRSRGDNNRKELENQKQIVLLQKRVRELEMENMALRAENKGLKIENDSRKTVQKPLLPDTPVPSVPKMPSVNNLGQTSIAIAPPPQIPSRRAQQVTAVNSTSSETFFNLNDVFNREKQVPDIATRLQNLQIDQMEDLFDDEFDPRADEKKVAISTANKDTQKANGNPQTANGSLSSSLLANNGIKHTETLTNRNAHSTTVEDFEALLKQIDERLAIVQEGEEFFSESLERGDTGDAGRDLADYSSVTNPQPPGTTATNSTLNDGETSSTKSP